MNENGKLGMNSGFSGIKRIWNFRFNGPDEKGSFVAYVVSVAGIMVFVVWTLFTGARVKMLPFKVCPVILTVAAIAIFIGALV